MGQHDAGAFLRSFASYVIVNISRDLTIIALCTDLICELTRVLLKFIVRTACSLYGRAPAIDVHNKMAPQDAGTPRSFWLILSALLIGING